MSASSLPANGQPATPAWRVYLIAALVSIAVASAGRYITDLGPWYAALKRPSFQPPDIWFGPAWTIIFAFAAASAGTAWRAMPAGTSARPALLALWGLNAVLNMAWSWLFFTSERPDWALIEVGLLWLSIVALILWSARWSARAAWLCVPYLAWVTFAAALNQAVVVLNGPFGLPVKAATGG